MVGYPGQFRRCPDRGQEDVRRCGAGKGNGRRQGYQFSSANSINIGRLVPQIVYYVYAYGRLLQSGRDLRGRRRSMWWFPPAISAIFWRPTTRRQMGLPIGKLICASNENKVLFDFFRTGVYDRNREFILTNSPVHGYSDLQQSGASDLPVSPGRMPRRTRLLMKALVTEGRYEITPEMREQLADFYGNYATERGDRRRPSTISMRRPAM